MREQHLKADDNLGRKCLITVLLLLGIRFLSCVPTPGVNTAYFKLMIQQNESLGFLNALMGSGLSSMSIMALSITPYITASIIMQLMGIVFPKIHEMQHSSMKDERDYIEKCTIILGVVMALLESFGIASGFGRQGMLVNYTWQWVLVVSLFWAAGSSLASYVGKLITDEYIGNGVSLILCMNILSSYFPDARSVYQTMLVGKTGKTYAITLGAIVLVLFLLFALTVWLQETEKRIPVNYSQKLGQATNTVHEDVIPIKLCPASVVPIIFASSALTLPILIASAYHKENMMFFKYINTSNWFDPKHMQYTAGIILYIAMVFFFTYYYTDITMNPMELADNLKKSYGSIPGVRPGDETTAFLREQMRVMLGIGAAAMCLVAILPFIFSGLFGIRNTSFLGTSIIITVGVIYETGTTLHSLMCGRKYFKKSEKGGLLRA